MDWPPSASTAVRVARQSAGVTHDIAGAKVVGSVHDKVVCRDELPRVARREPELVAFDPHERVDGGDAVRCRIDFWAPDIDGGVNNLALQVRYIDDVVIDDPQRADPGCGEVGRRDGTQPARSDDEHARRREVPLAAFADFGKEQVAGIARPGRHAQRPRAQRPRAPRLHAPRLRAQRPRAQRPRAPRRPAPRRRAPRPRAPRLRTRDSANRFHPGEATSRAYGVVT